MCYSATDRYAVLQAGPMPVSINGIDYFSAGEILRELGVSRQTLYRWRQDGKVPPGHRFRDGKLLFELNEVEEIREFASRIDHADVPREQMRLFRRSI